jgi:hypothetical protein
MRKIVKIVIISLILIPLMVEAKEYRNIKKDYKMIFPDYYYIIDEENIEENRTFIESYGIPADNIKSILKTREEVTVAIRSDEQIIIHIDVIEDRTSKKIWELSRVKEKEISEIKEEISKEIGEIITSQEYREIEYEVGKNKYLKTVIEKEEGTYLVLYTTIYNGKRYSVKVEGYDKERKGESLAEIESMYGSFEITKRIDKPILRRDMMWVIVGGILLIGFTCLLVIQKKKPNKK